MNNRTMQIAHVKDVHARTAHVISVRLGVNVTDVITAKEF